MRKYIPEAASPTLQFSHRRKVVSHPSPNALKCQPRRQHKDHSAKKVALMKVSSCFMVLVYFTRLIGGGA
jgi:hypothetical protein